MYSETDKLQNEVEKLIAEVHLLKKPYLQPTFWIGMIALTVSVAGNIGQALTYESKAVIAKAEVAQAKLDRIEMESKRDEAKDELTSRQNELARIKQEINNARQASSSEQVKNTLDKVEQKVTNLEESTQKATLNLDKSESSATQEFRKRQIIDDSTSTNPQIISTTQKGTRLQIAQTKEREGFENLISGNYGAAATAFQTAENTYPRYHNVYELARILRSNQAEMSDPAKQKEIFRTIVSKYSYGAPPDLWEQVKAIANR